jgi:hypothetical protein
MSYLGEDGKRKSKRNAGIGVDETPPPSVSPSVVVASDSDDSSGAHTRSGKRMNRSKTSESIIEVSTTSSTQKQTRGEPNKVHSTETDTGSNENTPDSTDSADAIGALVETTADALLLLSDISDDEKTDKSPTSAFRSGVVQRQAHLQRGQSFEWKETSGLIPGSSRLVLTSRRDPVEERNKWKLSDGRILQAFPSQLDDTKFERIDLYQTEEDCDSEMIDPVVITHKPTANVAFIIRTLGPTDTWDFYCKNGM